MADAKVRALCCLSCLRVVVVPACEKLSWASAQIELCLVPVRRDRAAAGKKRGRTYCATFFSIPHVLYKYVEEFRTACPSLHRDGEMALCGTKKQNSPF